MSGSSSSVGMQPAGSGRLLPARRALPARTLWLALAVALFVIGLGLRLGIADQVSVDLARWLPWLDRPTVTVYFPDSRRRFLVPVTRYVSGDGAGPRGAVVELLRGPRDRAMLGSPFPPDTRFSALGIEDGVALVSVTSGKDGAAHVAYAPLALETLSRTLRRFPEVKSVRLLVDGRPAGQAQATLPPEQSHPIYYTYGNFLVPVSSTASSPDEALRRYLAGPDAGAGLNGLPEDVRLLEYRFDASRGLAYVNLSYTQSVRQLALDEPYRIRRSLIGIVATLTEFPQVKAVMLDFEGNARLGLGQCADLLRAPQVRPKALNDEAVLSSL